MPGPPFSRGPGRIPFMSGRSRLINVGPFVQANDILGDLPPLLLKAVIIPGDKTTEGQLIETVALPWFEIIELIRQKHGPESPL